MILANTDDKYIRMARTPRKRKRKEREQRDLGSRDSELSLLREKEGTECFSLLFAFMSDVLTISLICCANNIAHVNYREYRFALALPAFYSCMSNVS